MQTPPDAHRSGTARPALTPDLWRRIKDVVAAALDVPSPDRENWVARVCAGDAALYAEAMSLLHSTLAATTHFEETTGAFGSRLFTAPDHIGPYRIIRELATGGMGSVYLAEREGAGFEQTVAIKIVRGGLPDPFLLQRFVEERRILASLEHPNIARLVDGGATETGLPYVVMEYVEGEPIDVFCDARRLDTRRRLEVFLHVCAAVQYAHQRLVIHRDIKPNNILVTRSGVPKLLDFGIAKLLQPPGDDHRPALTTVRVMTPESASPEQLSGGTITIAVDVYALGVLLYRLLAGRSPYGKSFASDTDLIRAVCEEIPAPPSRTNTRAGERIGTELDTIVLKALRKEPDRRYASVEQFADDVKRYLEGRPVLAVPESTPYKVRKFVRRHTVAVVAGAALLLTLAGGLAATTWQARVAARERARAERQFNAVRQLANSVVWELNDAVSPLPGSTKAQELLLRRATEYLDALFEEATVKDVGLRRELAGGYQRLGVVQGAAGGPNIGDREAAHRSFTRALALLEPLAANGDVRDRLEIARLHARLAAGSDAPEAEQHRVAARSVIDGLSASERAETAALGGSIAVWQVLTSKHIERKEWEPARELYARQLDAAIELLRREPESLQRSRDVSIIHKQLGAILEMLKRRDEAVVLYRKALALDEARVAKEPARPLWRLDLSFSHGAIGAALMSAGDPEGALHEYGRAVELRERVASEDTNDDFAQVSLARGYERLAVIHGRLGNAAQAKAFAARRLAIYRTRALKNPERENVWRDFASTLFGLSQWHLSEAQADQAGRAMHLDAAKAVIDELVKLRAEWTKRRFGPLSPDDRTIDETVRRYKSLRR